LLGYVEHFGCEFDGSSCFSYSIERELKFHVDFPNSDTKYTP